MMIKQDDKLRGLLTDIPDLSAKAIEKNCRYYKSQGNSTC